MRREPRRGSGQADSKINQHPDLPLSGAAAIAFDLYAPDELRLVWARLVSSVDRLRWLIEVGGAYVDPAATGASKDDKEIAAVYHSIDELTRVVRRASAMR